MISVVTITFNNFEELKATLESLHGVPNVESVVINGGSCERTREWLSGYPGVVVNERDQGISDAFNKGIAHSTGMAIAFLNSGDVLLRRDYYERAHRELESDPEIAFIYSDLEFVDEIAGPVTMRPRSHAGNLGRGMPFPHPTLVVRRQVFDQVGNFSLDYRIAMDFDFVVRMMAQGYQGKYLPIAAVRMDGKGVSSAREWDGLQECRRSLEDHGQFGGATRLGYLDRWFRYRVRRALMTTPGRPILKLVKLLKSALR